MASFSLPGLTNSAASLVGSAQSVVGSVSSLIPLPAVQAALAPLTSTLASIQSFLAQLPGGGSPVPTYAIVRSDTFDPLASPDSWGEFSPKYETAMSDYPQELGAFQNFNKVKRPWTVNITVVKSGSDAVRSAWLANILQQEIANPTQTYNLVSPNGVFLNYAVSGMSFETRADKGSNILYLNLQFTEIPIIDPNAANAASVAGVPGAGGPLPGFMSGAGQISTQLAAAAKSLPVVQVGNLVASVASLAQTRAVNVASVVSNAANAASAASGLIQSLGG